MKRRLVALGAFVLFWLVFFFFARMYFILTHSAEAFPFGVMTLVSAFTHGIKLDVSAASYILIVPLLSVISGIWLSGKWTRYFVRYYTLLILVVSIAIMVGDSVLYTYWGFRMDYTPLIYLKTPREAAASVTTLKIIETCLIISAITVFFVFIYIRSVDRLFSNHGVVRYKPVVTLTFLVLLSALIIPIRGGVGVAPINAGSVYFSESLFINHTAINVVWNVGSSYFNREPAENPYEFGDLESSRALVESITAKTGPSDKFIDKPVPNILFIILESFGNTLVGPLGGDSLTTPRLNALAREGILFSNIYASGNRTDKALPAILNGYPAQPATSIIKEPKKTQSLSSLVKIMNGLDYHSSFWYGGDIDFANFNSFIISSGFQEIITMDNFDRSSYNSKWGVHDHVLFEALKDSMKAVKEPFFRVVLTLSSHEPFEVPMQPVFQGKDNLTKFRNSIYYTDRTVGDFIEWAKKTEWWKNTLVILVADHCRRNSLDELVYDQRIFKIPMLWAGGTVKSAGLVVSKLGSQVDIPVTLLDQISTEGDFPFGKDLLSEESDSFAFYTFNEGFAFITDSSTVIYDHKLGKPVFESGKQTQRAELLGKAYLQVLYDDYLKR